MMANYLLLYRNACRLLQGRMNEMEKNRFCMEIRFLKMFYEQKNVISVFVQSIHMIVNEVHGNREGNALECKQKENSFLFEDTGNNLDIRQDILADLIDTFAIKQHIE